MHLYWHDGIPSALVTVVTFGLAFLGGYVALNPPRDGQKTLKIIYVVSFALLACLGIGADLWQKNIENRRQEVLRQAQENAEIRFSKNLEDVKQSNIGIFEFLTNLPKGVTGEQAASLFREYLDRVPKPTNLYLAGLPSVMHALQHQADTLHEFFVEYMRKDDDAESRVLAQSQAQAASILPDIDRTRVQALSFLGTPTKRDKAESAIISAAIRDNCVGHDWPELLGIETYLRELIERLQAEITRQDR